MPFKIPEPCSKFLAQCFQNRVAATVSTLVAGSAIAATALKLYQSPTVQGLHVQFNTTAVPFFKREIFPFFYKQGQLTRVGAAVSAVVAVKALSVLLNKIFPSKDSIKTLNERVAALTGNLQTATELLANSQPKPTAAEIQQKTEEAEQAAQQLTNLAAQLAEAIIDRETKETELTAAREANARALLDLQQKQEAYNALIEQMQKPQAEQDQQDVGVADNVQKLAGVQKELEQANQTLQTKESELTALQEKVLAAETAFQDLTSEHAWCSTAAERIADTHKQALETQKKTITELEETCRQVKDGRALAEQQVEALTISLGDANAQLNAVNEQLSTQERQELIRLRASVPKLQERVNTLVIDVEREKGVAETAKQALQKYTASSDRALSDRRLSVDSPRNNPPLVLVTPIPRPSTPTHSTSPTAPSNLTGQDSRPPAHPTSGRFQNLDPSTREAMNTANKPKAGPAFLQKQATFRSGTTTTTTTTTTTATTTSASPQKQGKGKGKGQGQGQQAKSPQKPKSSTTSTTTTSTASTTHATS